MVNITHHFYKLQGTKFQIPLLNLDKINYLSESDEQMSTLNQ
jgi:hypothetical protein